VNRFEIKTALLRALCACIDPSRAHLAGIVFRNGEIVATNGYVLVRVPAKHELNLMVPYELAFAACAAQEAFNVDMHDEDGFPVDHLARVFVAEHEGKAIVDIGNVVLASEPGLLEKFPPHTSAEKVTQTNDAGAAHGLTIDPKLFGLFRAVIDATDSRGCGAKLVGGGGPLERTVWQSPSGVLFSVMPMRDHHKKKEAA
jgi:hypothetical protein